MGRSTCKWKGESREIVRMCEGNTKPELFQDCVHKCSQCILESYNCKLPDNLEFKRCVNSEGVAINRFRVNLSPVQPPALRVSRLSATNVFKVKGDDVVHLGESHTKPELELQEGPALPASAHDLYTMAPASEWRGWILAKPSLLLLASFASVVLAG